MNLRIALISFSNNYDMQKYLYTLYNNLKEKAFTITIGSTKLIDNVDIDKHNFLIDVPNKPGIEFRTLNFSSLSRLIRIIKLHKINVVYYLSSHIWNIFLYPHLKRNNISILHSIHDPIPHPNEGKGLFIYNYNRLISKYTDLIILHSKNFKDLFCRKYNFPEKKVSILNLWHQWLDFNELKTDNTLLFFGRINPYKGVLTFKKIAQKVSNKIFIVGKVHKKIKQEVYELPRNFSHIKLIDRYVSEKEMNTFFDNAGLVLLPYKSATQSGVIIEAYRHSRPVVAFNTGAINEQIIDKKTGFLVHEGDVDGFVCAIDYYKKLDFSEKVAMCRNAWEFGKLKYSPSKAAENIVNISLKILSKKLA
ncbi:glycosyltransferase family 4 protein [Kosmotoga olearia]|uniref:Glycosyl transferase group 1 n=1 Tax=Kosmotoga olearia (strain ATCC BAA-1733 / DSM 21960 / TBF 19.5.1) TaxID=521045 RepID=C5CDC0_KOSOT|nr:glycosyltransferase family 4 protein [Kosmotoga olearia]ACR79983.1 glycosyl transferase group 1 [Kosmotoga olearia TBF 19.5.1]